MHSLKKVSDNELIRLLRDGNHHAFTHIYHRYKSVLVIHAYKKLGNFDDAKEIVQDMFTALWHGRSSLPYVQNISGYLYTLTRNRVLNFIEHRQVESRYAASFRDFAGQQHHEPEEQLREKEMKAIINREIDALPPKMREVFLLSREQHLTHKQISERLNISEYTVKNHIKEALKVLRVKLGLITLILICYFF